jgi:hypothetical protein
MHDPIHRRPGEAMSEMAGDPDRLLHGEDPGTGAAGDAPIAFWEGRARELGTEPASSGHV